MGFFNSSSTAEFLYYAVYTEYRLTFFYFVALFFISPI